MRIIFEDLVKQGKRWQYERPPLCCSGAGRHGVAPEQQILLEMLVDSVVGIDKHLKLDRQGKFTSAQENAGASWKSWAKHTGFIS